MFNMFFDMLCSENKRERETERIPEFFPLTLLNTNLYLLTINNILFLICGYKIYKNDIFNNCVIVIF